MAIDFSRVDQNAPEIPDYNADVAYLRQHAKAFVTRIDAQESLNTSEVLPLPAGTWNTAFVLLPANVVVKISPWSDQFEADFLKLATSVQASVPACIGYGSIADETLPHASYVLMQHIEHSQTAGVLFDQKLLTDAELLSIAQKLGAALAQLHSLPFPHVRSFNDTRLDWGSCLGLWALAETSMFNAGLFAQFETVLDRTQYRQQRSGVLTHSDANLHNILVDAKTHAFRALIDPGPQIAGLPMYDLAIATQPWKYGVAYRNALIESYQDAGGIFDAVLFNTSLLCAAYQLSKYKGHATDTMKAHLRLHVLPALT
jgi:aminoglycoside phosphotransferase (APT) family kinase protein